MVTIAPSAVVQTDAIGEGSTIGEFAVIRAGAVLGRRVTIHPHVVIAEDVVIGDDVEIMAGAVLGRIPKGAGATTRAPTYKPFVRIGAGCSIGPYVVVYMGVQIGESTLLGDGASIREGCVIGSRCIISRYVTVNYDTTIGDGSKVMDMTHITGNATIGDNVFISVNVTTVNDNAIGRKGYDSARVAGPTVRDGAAVGAGAILLPGVVIGENATVGAGSVVSRDVKPGITVMGIPARDMRIVASERLQSVQIAKMLAKARGPE